MKVLGSKIFIHSMILLVPILLISCAPAEYKSRERNVLLSSNRKLVFIEPHDRGGQTGYGGFGDVVIFDLDTRTKMKITDDEYYDTEPRWSPDGKKVLFQSTREGSSRARQISGVSGSREIFVYDCESQETKQVDIGPQMGLPLTKRAAFENLQWFRSSNQLIFSLYIDTYLYYGYTNSDTVDIMGPFYEGGEIRDYKVNNEGSYICIFILFDKDSSNYGLLFYDNNEKQLRNIIMGYCTIGNWSKDGNNILIKARNTIIEYQVGRVGVDTVFIEKADAEETIINAYYIGGPDVLLIMREKKYNNNDPQQEYTQWNKFYIYNRITKKMELILNDDEQRDEIDVFYK